MITDTECAYAAGLLDGEGSIVIGVSYRPLRNPNGRKHHSYWLQVGVTNTDQAMVTWLHERFGGHISHNRARVSRHGRRTCWVWRVMCRDALAFLLKARPYLVAKGQQADIAIAFQQMLITHGSRRFSDPVAAVAVRESYRQQLRALTLGAQTSVTS